MPSGISVTTSGLHDSMNIINTLLTISPNAAAGLEILGVVAVVLALDLLAMLGADRTLKTPFVAIAFGISGSVMAKSSWATPLATPASECAGFLDKSALLAR